MILITYGMKYITMEAVLMASIFARDGASSTMCYLEVDLFKDWVFVPNSIEFLEQHDENPEK